LKRLRSVYHSRGAGARGDRAAAVGDVIVTIASVVVIVVVANP
jgi:hypothetical protein